MSGKEPGRSLYIALGVGQLVGRGPGEGLNNKEVLQLLELSMATAAPDQGPGYCLSSPRQTDFEQK